MITRVFNAPEPGPVCWVFGAAPQSALPKLGCRPGPEDFVIAADGGLRLCEALGLTPHLLLGDLDSLGESVPAGLPLRRLPVEKDDTDTLAALREGLARGYRFFRLYGGTGGRFDHTLANLQSLLFLARQGATATLYDPHFTATLLENGSLRFPAGLCGTVSVFAFGGPAEGVCETGLKYQIENVRLTPDFPLGVSNALLGQEAEISVKSGALLILYLS